MIQVKAMELIDQLEPTRRGPYSGGFGGISFVGDMDIALALRTIVFLNDGTKDTLSSRRQEWIAHLQSGAGIVADSNPDSEQKECENKVAGLCRAIDLAESAFVKTKREPQPPPPPPVHLYRKQLQKTPSMSSLEMTI